MTQQFMKKTVSSARAQQPETTRRTACAPWLLAFAVATIPAAAIAATDLSTQTGDQAEKTVDNRGANTTAQGAMKSGDGSMSTSGDATTPNTDNGMNDAGSTSTGTDGMNDAGSATDASQTGASATGAAATGGGERFLTSEEFGDVTSEQLEDAKVITSDGKDIGEVKNIVISSDHKVRALVVDVGGFLGMGQKDVAVNIDQFEQSRGEDNKLHLKLQATKDELKAAPEFKPLKD